METHRRLDEDEISALRLTQTSSNGVSQEREVNIDQDSYISCQRRLDTRQGLDHVVTKRAALYIRAAQSARHTADHRKGLIR